MYSPHSWCAICFLGLWGLQLAGGLYIHTYNPASYPKLHKYHRFLGKAVYVVGLATCALGFQDMQASDLAGTCCSYGLPQRTNDCRQRSTVGMYMCYAMVATGLCCVWWL